MKLLKLGLHGEQIGNPKIHKLASLRIIR